jgi:hypothetical protein
MEFSITFYPWMVPTGITLLWFIAIILAIRSEWNETGMRQGLHTAFVLVVGFAIVVTSWITFALVRWLS